MRNPEYKLIGTDVSPLLSSLISAYEHITKSTLAPASPDRLFVHWVADVILQLLVKMNWAANQNLPSRADGGNLDELGQLFYGIERPGSKHAVSTQRFSIDAPQNTSVLIPGKTRVSDINRSLIWETAGDAYIPIGELHADVEIRCQACGVAGNGYAPGQLSTLIDAGINALIIHTENITHSDGGSDAATDDEYYAHMRERMDAVTTAGSRGSYIFHAKSVSTEIADAVANAPGPGRVDVYALMKDGTVAGEVIKAAIYDACSPETVRPLTDHVSIGDPDIVEYCIDFTYFIPSRSPLSSASVEEAVLAAVGDYIRWQHGELGRDINPDELRRRVMAAGVKRIELNEPSFAVLKNGKGHYLDDPENLIPQVARAAGVVVINGGFEDE